MSAALAAVLIYAFVSHYRHNTVAAPTNATVFVARHYIPPGTPASEIASQDLMQRTTVSSTQAIAGAIADPSAITNQVSSVGIAAGQQITVMDFSTAAKATISSYLKGDYRAAAFPLDAAHGLTSYIRQGSRVDVMGQRSLEHSKGQTEMLAENVEVLANASGDVILKLTDKQVMAITAATGKFSLWLSLRPDRGGKQTVKVGALETL